MTRDIHQLLDDHRELLDHLRQKLRFQGKAPLARDVREFAQLLASRLSVIEQVILPVVTMETGGKQMAATTLARHAELRRRLAELLTLAPGHHVGGLMSEVTRVLELEESALSNELLPRLMRLPEEDRRALALEAESLLDKLVGVDSASFYRLDTRKAPWMLLEEARTVLTSLGKPSSRRQTQTSD
jgi:hypothetical protein